MISLNLNCLLKTPFLFAIPLRVMASTNQFQVKDTIKSIINYLDKTFDYIDSYTHSLNVAKRLGSFKNRNYNQLYFAQFPRKKGEVVYPIYICTSSTDYIF